MLGKMSELDLTVKELRSAAESLNSVADSLVSLFSQTEPLASEMSNATEPTKPKVVTLEEVRGVLAEKSRNGKTDAIRELLAKYGCHRLSDISPDCFADLLKDAEEL